MESIASDLPLFVGVSLFEIVSASKPHRLFVYLALRCGLGFWALVGQICPGSGSTLPPCKGPWSLVVVHDPSVDVPWFPHFRYKRCTAQEFTTTKPDGRIACWPCPAGGNCTAVQGLMSGRCLFLCQSCHKAVMLPSRVAVGVCVVPVVSSAPVLPECELFSRPRAMLLFTFCRHSDY